MPTKTFKKEDLISALDGASEPLQEVWYELVDTSRWSNIYELVFKDVESGLYYQTTYSVGATECQDESPFEYDPDEIECSQVEQVEKVVKVWQDVK